MRGLVLVILALSLFATGCSGVKTPHNATLDPPAETPSYSKKIAIYSDGHPFFLQPISLSTATEHARKKGYAIASNRDMELVKRELLNTANRERIRNPDASYVSKFQNIDAILLIEIVECQVIKHNDGKDRLDRMTITARLVDVQRALVVWSDDYTVRNNNLLMLPVNILAILLTGDDIQYTKISTSGVLNSMPRANSM
ncbi:MAG: hypothetical protein ACLGSA_15235 [Acidobacteriota bacterium]